jgi:hypothetical protein
VEGDPQPKCYWPVVSSYHSATTHLHFHPAESLNQLPAACSESNQTKYYKGPRQRALSQGRLSWRPLSFHALDFRAVNLPGPLRD